MSRTIGFVMDPLASINTKKDSSYAMMLAAAARGWRIWHMELADLTLRDGHTLARRRELTLVAENEAGHGAGVPRWCRVGEPQEGPLAALDVVMMRKDPPFDMEYVYATYLLEQAACDGTLVVNAPAALRDANEKVFTARFAHCAPPTLVARRAEVIEAFLAEHGEMIVKPLDGMGGASIFRVRESDPNRNVIVETMTAHGRRFCMAQRFIPEIAEGDKRILIVAGEAVPYALARIPAPGDPRGNLAAGARAEARALTERDRWIAAQVAPELLRRGILFAGLDVIGDYLTEINVTSPTCIRELDAACGLDIAGDLLERIEQRLHAAGR